MSLKNRRFAEWLEKFNQFYSESIAGLRRIKVKIRRRETERRVRWYHFPTQKIRREVARKLGDLYDIAVEYAKDDSLNQAERRQWARLAAFIAQTINAILRTYDDMEVERAIEELKKEVNKLVRA